MQSGVVTFSQIIRWRKNESGFLIAAVGVARSSLAVSGRFPERIRLMFQQQIRPCFPSSINHFLGLTENRVAPVVPLELRTTPS